MRKLIVLLLVVLIVGCGGGNSNLSEASKHRAKQKKKQKCDYMLKIEMLGGRDDLTMIQKQQLFMAEKKAWAKGEL